MVVENWCKGKRSVQTGAPTPNPNLQPKRLKAKRPQGRAEQECEEDPAGGGMEDGRAASCFFLGPERLPECQTGRGRLQSRPPMPFLWEIC